VGSLPLKIGDLRHYIELQSYNDFTDVYGKTVRTWETYATVFAQVTPTSNSESINGLQLNSSTTHAVMIRYRDDVQSNHRILFGSRILNIQSVRNLDEMKVALGIVCQEACSMSGGIPQ
jgi:SPP1 family predicted phage head-tail adaptor